MAVLYLLCKVPSSSSRLPPSQTFTHGACSCHGPAIFPGVIDPSTNKSIIHGKTITGFTTEAEYDMGLMDTIRGWGEPLVDEWAERLGAKCESLIQGLALE